MKTYTFKTDMVWELNAAVVKNSIKAIWVDGEMCIRDSLIAVRNRLITLLSALTETVEGKKAEIGGYHPAYERMVEYLRDYDFLINFGINEMAAYGENAHIYTEEEVREVLQRAVSKQNDKLLKADQMEAMLECIEKWCDFFTDLARCSFFIITFV